MKDDEVEILKQKIDLMHSALSLMHHQYTIMTLTLEEVVKLCVELKCHHEPGSSPSELRSQISQSIQNAYAKLIQKDSPSDYN